MPNVDESTVQVDISPPQPERFALTQTEGQTNEEQRQQVSLPLKPDTQHWDERSQGRGCPMPNPHPPYPPEFKAEAVRLYRESGRSLQAVSKDLGVSLESLRAWVNQAKVDAGEKAGLTTEERAELARLRKENRTLRMERDLLKKAAAYFARESETG